MKNLCKVLLIFFLIFAVFSNAPVHTLGTEETVEYAESTELAEPVSRTIQNSSSPVYVIPVTGTVDAGMMTFINRAFSEAEENNAAAIVLEINTPGGFVWAVIEIRDTIQASNIPVIAFVNGGAISAGALIALISDELVMAPGTTMGAAEPQLGGERADAKTLSYWVGQLEAAAEANGRDPLIARAMADYTVVIPGVTEEGEILTLTPNRALELGMIDHILPNRQAVLEEYGLTGNPIIELEPEFAEAFVRWVTNPVISTILLTVGLVGLVLEIFTPGFGIPGLLGLAALSLYFAGHIIGGIVGYWVILLFMLGVILLAVEVLFLPGFGVPGIAGVAALAAGIIMASPTAAQGVSSLVIALIGSAVLIGISLKFLPTRKRWKKLVLGDSLTSDEGFNSSSVELQEYLGQEGVSVTPLRPSGTAKIGNTRVDVVSQSGFIDAGTKVKVAKVEGNRVVVEEIEDES